ncbi:MAG: hypothetical protein KKA67_16875 [Spirochaetes bacterium]|nr:hypothetical protein [Spirochaetota bacterium]MBU1081826.1 hypothetical protein [Spirochaetota bacterium]
MSDDTGLTPAASGKPTKKAASLSGPRQKIFNVVGWLAFGLLLPPVLTMLKLPALQDFMTARLGGWGSPVALVVYFYAVLFLRVFFGSDQRYGPVLLGYALSFLYFSNALDIGFMRWLYDLAHRLPFLSYDAMSLIAGIVVVFLANALSGAKKAHWVVDVIALVLLPAGALVAAGIYLPGLLGL